MTQKMMELVERNIKLYEAQIRNGMEVPASEIQKTNNVFENFIKNNSEVSDEIKNAYEERLTNLTNFVGGNKKTYITLPKDDVEKIKSFDKAKLTGVIAATVGAIVLAGAGGYAVKAHVDAKAAEEVVTPIDDQDSTPVEEDKAIEPEVKKVLSESLAFDPNDNSELVDRMISFIADSLTKGIPVKDVMTEEEIALAEKNDESLVTIAQLMDFYMVMNIEDIDPADYIRLKYNEKTAETITDNYMYCARVFMTDSLTAKESDEIDYTKIIAHKDSAEQLQKFVDYLAKYNDSKVNATELREYIMDQYIEKDANLYSMSANEFTYRLMFDADLISNNSVLPKDMNIILNEDGKISCDTVKDDGVKNKTEKAEEFTSIYNTVEEKLEISRDFADQDLTNIDENELKTGVELEEEIKNGVLALNVRYNLNPKFEFAKGVNAKAGSGSTKKSASYVTGVSPSTGKSVNVSKEEMAKYGATTIAEYETNKKAAWEAAAKADPNHTIKNTEGKVVVSGSQVDTAQYNSGYSAGYSDGNNKRSSNPGSSNASYVAGYNEGYAKGLADRNALDASYSSKTETYFEDTTDKVVEQSTTVVEQPYTGPITEPAYVEPAPVQTEPVTEFVPVEETVETVETIEVIDYVSSLKNMRDMLVATKNVDTNNTSKSMKV